MFLLYETASGYALFESSQFENIGKNLNEVQEDVLDLGKFGKAINLKSFIPFKTAAHALENINSISEGVLHSFLKDFLELNLPKASKKSSIQLGVTDKALAGSIKQELGYDCISDDAVAELTRGIRFHCDKLLRQLSPVDMIRAQLGLSHSYSRSKVKYNVNRSDNMIIQAIALCDQLDKDINLFSMRIREWFSWHFPELAKLVSDNLLYAKLCVFIRNRQSLTDDRLEALSDLIQDIPLAQRIVDAAKTSMGTDISEIDVLNIDNFASRLVNLANYRRELGEYLSEKMNVVAPNLAALIGDSVGARLISKAGSLTNLAKFPASTIQILGAEKALFRALKTRGKTPKYGLIYNSSFIGRAASKNKGRISRFLANKCSIASRIDTFSDIPTHAFGDALKKQVEERLEFFDKGTQPQPNAKVISNVLHMLMESKKSSAVASLKRSREQNTSEERNVKVEKMDGSGMVSESLNREDKASKESKNKGDKDKKKKEKSSKKDNDKDDILKKSHTSDGPRGDKKGLTSKGAEQDKSSKGNSLKKEKQEDSANDKQKNRDSPNKKQKKKDKDSSEEKESRKSKEKTEKHESKETSDKHQKSGKKSRK